MRPPRVRRAASRDHPESAADDEAAKPPPRRNTYEYPRRGPCPTPDSGFREYPRPFFWPFRGHDAVTLYRHNAMTARGRVSLPIRLVYPRFGVSGMPRPSPTRRDGITPWRHNAIALRRHLVDFRGFEDFEERLLSEFRCLSFQASCRPDPVRYDVIGLHSRIALPRHRAVTP